LAAFEQVPLFQCWQTLRRRPFIAGHSRLFQSVDLKIKGRTSDYEDVSLLLASGWKTNSP
jgi:hypothetical protein